MPLLPPPCTESTLHISFPRENTRIAAELAAVTEVTERAVYAMYDAMRGAQTSRQRTAAGRRGR